MFCFILECSQTERFSKCDVLEVLWTIYPPKGVGLTGVKKSRWIRPVIDGEEAWSLLGTLKCITSKNLT